MKKFLALFLCAALLLTGALPAFAADSDTPPDEIILQAKAAFGITTEFDVFYYNTEKDEFSGLTIYDLIWENTETYANAEVIIDENGYIYRYYSYVPDKSSSSALPALSRAEALELAMGYVEEIFPKAADEITAERAQIEYSYNYYYVRFDRTINGIRVANSAIELSIGKDDGSLVSYAAYNWPQDVTVTEGEVISAETALKKFEQKLPLVLQYVSVYDRDTGKNNTMLVYAPPKGYDTSYLDARTGEVIKLDYASRDFSGSNGSVSEDSAEIKGEGGLTEEELAEIDKHASLWKTDALLEKLAAMPELDYSSDIALSSSKVTYTVSRYSDQVFYRAALDFPSKDFGGQHAVFDAETGELLSFYRYTTKDGETEITISKEDAQAIAEAFLMANKGDKFAQTLLEMEDSSLSGDSYYFRYIRQVNGVPFSANYLTVTVDAQSGKITFVSEAWNTDAIFEELTGEIGITQAIDAYFDYYGDEYFYLPVVQTEEGKKAALSYYSDAVYTDVTLLPVYAYEFSCLIGAKSGKVLNYSGQEAEPYERYTSLDSIYPQLEGHYIKDIAAKLHDADIMLSDAGFDPDAAIAAGEFRTLLQNLNRKASSVYDMDLTESTALTRMEAVKEIILALGYGDIAQHAEYFVCTFADAAEIGAENIGYAALAQMLGIAAGNNNNFMPNRTLSNAEALVLVYNCLKQK